MESSSNKPIEAKSSTNSRTAARSFFVSSSCLHLFLCLSCFAIFFVHCFFSNFSNSHVLCSWAVVSHFLLCSILWWSPPFWVLPLVLHLFFRSFLLSYRGGNSTWEFSPTVCLLHVLSEWINSPIKAQGSPDPIKTTNGTIRPIKHHNLFQKRVPSSESIMSSKPGGKQNGINDLRWNKKEQVSLPGSMMHTGKNREKTSNTTRKPDSGCHVKSIFMQGCSLRSFFERDRF